MGFILLVGRRKDRFICHEQNDIFLKKNKLLIIPHLFEWLHVVIKNFAKPEIISLVS